MISLTVTHFILSRAVTNSQARCRARRVQRCRVLSVHTMSWG